MVAALAGLKHLSGEYTSSQIGWMKKEKGPNKPNLLARAHTTVALMYTADGCVTVRGDASRVVFEQPAKVYFLFGPSTRIIFACVRPHNCTPTQWFATRSYGGPDGRRRPASLLFQRPQLRVFGDAKL